MANAETHEQLIRDLVADLRPVRRLPPPGAQAVLWLAVVAAAAAVLAMTGDLAPIRVRLAAAPDMWLAIAGSSLTGVLAAIAAFQLGRPDRTPAWALLPLPAAALWVGASGLGCVRTWGIAGISRATLGVETDCVLFIVGVSVPLSALLLAMLRRARPSRPGLMIAAGGLAAAAGAATLLTFFHPYDATASDLLAHAAAVAIVIAANEALAGIARRRRASSLA